MLLVVKIDVSALEGTKMRMGAFCVSAAMSLPLIALRWAPFPSFTRVCGHGRAQCVVHLDRLLVQLCHFGRQRRTGRPW